MTGSSLQADIAAKLVADSEITPDEMLAAAKTEALLTMEREKPGAVLVRGPPSFVVVAGIVYHSGEGNDSGDTCMAGNDSSSNGGD